jgi:hypothetical protein
MAVLSIDRKSFDTALNLLQRCQTWTTREDIITYR